MTFQLLDYLVVVFLISIPIVGYFIYLGVEKHFRMLQRMERMFPNEPPTLRRLVPGSIFLSYITENPHLARVHRKHNKARFVCGGVSILIVTVSILVGILLVRGYEASFEMW